MRLSVFPALRVFLAPFCLSLVFSVLALSFGAAPANAQVLSPDEVIFLTEEWTGERFPDGRPRVSDEVLERMKYVSLEEAWASIRDQAAGGYTWKFEGNWDVMHPDQVMVGRALTVAYMPASPQLQQRMAARGRAEGRPQSMDQWPVAMLQPGDVYVEDGFGKVVDGPVVGDNFARAIYTNSGNGIVVYGSARDFSGQATIEGYNAWVKEWHPSFVSQMTLMSVNGPTRIGEAVVLPGDVVLAMSRGVIFIPPHLTERVLLYSEVTRTTDFFRHDRIAAGVFTLQESYPNLTQAQIQMMYDWLPTVRTRLNEEQGVALSTIDRMIETRSTSWQQWLTPAP
jgi:regulator of RNase E activity RraA